MKKYLSILVIVTLTLFAACSSDDDDKVFYTVTFETDGGIPVPTAQKVEEGGIVTAPATIPTKEGYVFSFWHLSGSTTAYNFQTPVNRDFTLYAKWSGGGTDPSAYKMFTSVSALNSWLASQSTNTAETAYKVGLKDLNLDSGENWADLGDVIKTHDKKFLELNLENCGGTAIPDGYLKVTGAAITYIGLFAGRDNLLLINLPKSLKTIGKYTFAGCANPLSVILHEGLESIGEKVFYRCNLPMINLPEGLKTISKDAFRLAEITSITIPESVTDLGESAFDLCESLHTVVINAKLETIEMYTFRGTAIKTITFPASFKTLTPSAIYSCKSLEEIIMLSVTPPILTSDFTWAIESGGVSALKKIKVPSGSVETYKKADNWKNHADMIVAI